MGGFKNLQLIEPLMIKSSRRFVATSMRDTQLRDNKKTKVLESSYSHTFLGSSATSGLQSGGYHITVTETMVCTFCRMTLETFVSSRRGGRRRRWTAGPRWGGRWSAACEPASGPSCISTRCSDFVKLQNICIFLVFLVSWCFNTKPFILIRLRIWHEYAITKFWSVPKEIPDHSYSSKYWYSDTLDHKSKAL